MRGESMKGKSKKSTYSTTFGIDPKLLLHNFWSLTEKKSDKAVLKPEQENIRNFRHKKSAGMFP